VDGRSLPQIIIDNGGCELQDFISARSFRAEIKVLIKPTLQAQLNLWSHSIANCFCVNVSNGAVVDAGFAVLGLLE
jgi:hypothetical protein